MACLHAVGRGVRTLVAVTVLAGSALYIVGGTVTGSAHAEITKPTPIDILFERKHLTNVVAGTELVYRFDRTVTQPELLGQPFSDDIKVEIKKVEPNGTRAVVVKVFTGERARVCRIELRRLDQQVRVDFPGVCRGRRAGAGDPGCYRGPASARR